MEQTISRNILRAFFKKLDDCIDLDVAVVGAGPSGLICARDLALAGRKVAVFESHLKPGGGVWGGAMGFNEVVVQDTLVPLLEDLEVHHIESEGGMVTVDSVELAAALVYRTVNAGARIFNMVRVEDAVFKDDRVGGVVINWSPVLDEGLHVDPLVVAARCVVDAGGHDAELTAKIARKAGVNLDTATGNVMGERPMWAEQGEIGTVESSQCVYPGLYVSGMAANGVFGSFRMGPIFGGMLESGRKVARLICEELGG